MRSALCVSMLGACMHPHIDGTDGNDRAGAWSRAMTRTQADVDVANNEPSAVAQTDARHDQR